jgi:HPt (histidine-containing phosphotransfer) domain-containing protein
MGHRSGPTIMAGPPGRIDGHCMGHRRADRTKLFAPATARQSTERPPPAGTIRECSPSTVIPGPTTNISSSRGGNTASAWKTRTARPRDQEPGGRIRTLKAETTPGPYAESRGILVLVQAPAPMPLDWKPLFDRTRTLVRLEEDAELLRDLIDAYLANTPQLTSALQQAVATGDAGALQRAAHTLRGSISVFEVRALADECLAVESAGQDGRVLDAAPLLARLLPRLDAFAAELHAAHDEVA